MDLKLLIQFWEYKKDCVVKRKDAVITLGLLIPISRGPTNLKMLLYEFATTTQHPRLEASTTQTDLTALEAVSLRSTCRQVGYSKVPSPGHGDGHLLIGTSRGRPSGCVCVRISFYKAIGQKELGPKLMTSSYLHYFLKAPSPSTVTFWGPKYQNQHMISGDDTVQSKAASQKKKIYTHTQIHIYISGLS